MVCAQGSLLTYYTILATGPFLWEGTGEKLTEGGLLILDKLTN